MPVIQVLGYEAVRADQDTGSLIVTQMLERLYFADLVLADMTVPNGNVYYEIGIRQAAKASGCVLLAADWSRQLFDVAQMRTVRYPLPGGDITQATAAAMRSAIISLKDGLSLQAGHRPRQPARVPERGHRLLRARHGPGLERVLLHEQPATALQNARRPGRRATRADSASGRDRCLREGHEARRHGPVAAAHVAGRSLRCRRCG